MLGSDESGFGCAVGNFGNSDDANMIREEVVKLLFEIMFGVVALENDEDEVFRRELELGFGGSFWEIDEGEGFNSPADHWFAFNTY